ncbi:MAG: Arc family DNA-binding protein [Alkalispirochaeta sp.]
MAEKEKKSKTIRMPAELLARLERQAQNDHRNINQQIVMYIERGLDQDQNREK